MGDGYPEKQVRNKQEADCGIREVGMRNQKQQKAEDDTDRSDISSWASILGLAHRMSSAAASISDLWLSHSGHQLSLGP